MAASGTTRKHDMRWKGDERDTAKLYQRIDGVTENPILRRLITKGKDGTPIGRLGHLTELRIDSCSRSYMIESKRRSLPKWLHDAWCQVQQIAKDYGVHPVLVATMVDEQNTFTYEGKKTPCLDMHILDSRRHAELLRKERQIAAIEGKLADWQEADKGCVTEESLAEYLRRGVTTTDEVMACLALYGDLTVLLEETE